MSPPPSALLASAMADSADSPKAQDGCDQLLAGLRAQEPLAIARAYTLHHQAVRGFARRLLGDDAAAEDLVHEAFVTLPRAIRRFRGESSLKSFLISIAANHARHHLRAAIRRRQAMEKLAVEPTAALDHADEGTHRRELAELLVRALDRLPIDQRLAFVLCEVDGVTSKEAARTIGVPEATLRTRLFHAKRKLREQLEREGVR